jgi:hypothetical protein
MPQGKNSQSVGRIGELSVELQEFVDKIDCSISVWLNVLESLVLLNSIYIISYKVLREDIS